MSASSDSASFKAWRIKELERWGNRIWRKSRADIWEDDIVEGALLREGVVQDAERSSSGVSVLVEVSIMSGWTSESACSAWTESSCNVSRSWFTTSSDVLVTGGSSEIRAAKREVSRRGYSPCEWCKKNVT